MNAYNPTLLKAWQANMDIQMVGSEYGAAMYVCMYVSKSEPERLKHALHDTLQNIPPNASQRKRLSMIGATVLTHRQVSAQEAIYRLGGFPLIRSTRTAISVNSRYPKNRSRILKPRTEVSHLPDTSTQIFQPGTIEYYQDRPDGTEWDSMSLATFATNYTVTGKDGTTRTNHPKLKNYEKWVKKRQKPACLRVPYLTPASGDEYYYSLFVLFRPFRNESTDIVQQCETARDAFIRQTDDLDMNSSTFLNMAQQIQDAIVRIRLQDSTTPLDIAAQVAPNLTSLEGTESDLHDPSEQDDEYLRTNASMLATATSPNNDPTNDSGQPQTSADESLSWQQLSLSTMTDAEYQHALNSASADQKVVIDKVFSHNRSRILDSSTDQLLLFVTGGAGVGKSFLIKTIREMLIRTGQQHHNPVLLTAPTGIAAYNIGGVTVHSAFCLPVQHKKSATYVPLRAEKLKQFRMKFKDVAYVIIDEISMLSCHNFDFVNKRLCEIKDTTSDPTVLFGGLSLIVFGDLSQLKPVHGCYIFDTRKPESYLWKKFNVSLLTTNHHQADDKTWAEILNRIRTGQPTDADIDALKQRTTVDTTVAPFDTALRIYPTRKQVKEYNDERLALLTSSTSPAIYSIAAIDTRTSTPAYLTDEQIQESKPDNESETAGLAETLNLAQGSRVMLIRNVYTDEGLVNGAQGSVEGIEWGDDHNTMPRGIYVRFDNPSIGRSLRNPVDHQYREAILIRPITASFYGKFNVHWSRTQLPLTPCWATTVHKVQGITLSHAVIDIGSKVFTSGMSYVALSRVTNIQGLAIQSFDHRKLKTSEAALAEMSRLSEI